MKCVIIAAGQGSRLRPIARSKPLAPIQGAPLIERVIEAAHEGGATEFVVVTGYEAGPLEAFLAELSRRRGWPVACAFNPDWAGGNGLSAAAGARAAGVEATGERFLLMMADHLFDPGIVRGLTAAAPADAALTLAVDMRLDNPLVDLDDVTRVALGPGGRIVRIGKHLEPYDAFDTGVFLAAPALVGAIEADAAGGGAASLSAGVQRLADRGLAATWDIGARFWLDVDDAVAFERAEREQARFAGVGSAG